MKRGAYLDNHSNMLDFSHEKKGMSPLIATVLLIAFAVALGAMIMNWSSSLGEDANVLDCSAVTLIINPFLCYAENMIKMSVKNTGKTVESISIVVVDDTGETTKVLPDSRLSQGQILQRNIPFLKSGSAYLALIPHINFNEEVVPCESPAVEILDLPEC